MLIRCPECKAKAYTSTMEHEWICEYEEMYCKCPKCGADDDKVLDSRSAREGAAIRRRRECMACQKRFTTFEVVESVQTIVIKKNGTKQLFDRQKLLAGLLKACEKRPVNAETIAAEIEAELSNSLHQEVTSGDIGEMVMRKTKEADDLVAAINAILVAYSKGEG